MKARAAVPPSDSKGFSNADTNKRIRLSLRETRSDKAWPSGADRERGRETERARSGRERERVTLRVRGRDSESESEESE